MFTKKKIQIKLFFVLVLLSSKSIAQDLLVSEGNLGFNISLNLAFGTHFQRLGLNLHFFYVNDFFQANSEVRVYFNAKNLGPKLSYPELVLSQGLLFGYGAKQYTFFNPFLSSVSNQTSYLNSVAYSYNAWFNRRKTKQQTGIVAFQFNRISIISENDILARPTLDRFRTAAILIQYQQEDEFQAAINCTMWTGSMGNKHHILQKQVRSGCYMDTVGGVYTNSSHGLISAQIKYNIGYSQNLQANAGIDAEQIRNFVQNKVIHDMPFLPKKWNRSNNCHILMLDENEQPYLYQENQKVRKPKVFLNVFSNANVFY
ncbi:polymorphic toxin type 23 domain-containing protein [Aurantibacillus circumpalustris]|uniref:polymorphic toxin type 23 domain-containing protein n=1 Tax=Aurantibacillus circumpalustris TaxID=3036359 RepID=UPI00295C1603|nr:polymorphic toxin type 23 domain-containing protein [Aurantibacillus circumpalustris]